MELRYLGFEQAQNKRVYNFEKIAKGKPAAHFVVTADLQLFLVHHVAIQEGPGLCAQKLEADLERSAGGSHELTNEDLLAHAHARAEAEARKAESRGAGRRHTPAGSRRSLPWGGVGIGAKEA